ncbi:MAG: hypothetical protein U0V02_09125 [Anaerolineales bacterium]
MHRNHVRPLLALLALILASLACGPQKTIVVGGDVACSMYYLSTNGIVYRCACPMDGSTSDAAEFTTRELKEIDSSTIRSTACMEYNRQHSSQNENIQPAATEPPAEVPPTEEPAATEPPVASAPLNTYLAGTFTTCDNVSRYVNFTIAENPPAYDPAKFKILFNGQPATCTPAASNSKTLTCIYPPAPYGPPAVIEVYIGEERVNEFNFDGGKICDPVPPSNGNNDGPAPTEPPAATGEPGSSD